MAELVDLQQYARSLRLAVPRAPTAIIDRLVIPRH